MASRSFFRIAASLSALALVATGTAVVAQIDDAGDRVDSSGSFEVTGIVVDVRGETAEQARQNGWRLAQRKGWQQLSQRLRGSPSSLPDSALNGLVTGIVVENEQIGPNRYVARLGVNFGRARAGQLLGVAVTVPRSPPMLVVPLQISGGVATVFEQETPWVDAWNRYRTSGSTIDYVRLTGTGPDPLLLNQGQVGRRGRGWWRQILNQYGARDMVIPQVELYRQWPGGPVVGVFTAGYGPDNIELERFSLRVRDADGVPALLDEGIRRLDAAYQRGLANGILRPDPLLSFVPPSEQPEEVVPVELPVEELPTGVTPSPTDAGQSYAIQYDSPGVGAVSSSEAALRAIPGVSSANTSSLALGGVSVMSVTYSGSLSALRQQLESRGWQVQEGPGTLRIRRAASTPAAQPEGTEPDGE
ncbi:heavy-metal-associated domain-containing protein [Sphingomonas sp. AX6]|uniref:heavy-metal-associated domain-containing protein n=1 Tax=Sphingomonas sp. AX6 TaxID=2653171 RepID=UPI0012F06241|nr:heavy-metal-associated domain-containing protein [Sphingomonas sp. AX6]VXC92214.1 conserved exported hypothetical protein [Sphingomonas sp. AX6]